MQADEERELRLIERLIEEWECNRSEDTGGDSDSSVPAPLKPKPYRNSGAVALPEPHEDPSSSDL